jgi:AcrR family transcriptional regulator
VSFKGRTKQEIVVEFRHEEILEAARKSFAEKGFRETSVEEIARRAGLAKGTIYLYYSSKQALYAAALKDGLASLGRRMENEVAAGSTIEEKIRAFISAKLTYFEEHRDFFRIYLAEFGNALAHPLWIHDDLRLSQSKQIQLLTSALEEAVASRRLRRLRPEAVALAIMNMTRGAVASRLLGLSKAAIEEDIDLLFELTWKGLAGK